MLYNIFFLHIILSVDYLATLFAVSKLRLVNILFLLEKQNLTKSKHFIWIDKSGLKIVEHSSPDMLNF